MSAADYLGGLAVFALVVGPVVVAAALVVRRWLPALEATPRVVAFGVVATAGVIAVQLLPGALGVLGRGSVVACALALLGGVAALARRGAGGSRGAASPPEAASEGAAWPPGAEGARSGAQGAPPKASPEGAASRGSWVVAAVGALATASLILAAASERITRPLDSIDMLTFHLPGIARWLQDGTLWRIDQFVPDLAHGNYPHNGDLVLNAAILPWHNDAFVRVVDLPFLALLALGVYAIGRELGAPRTTAILSGCLLVALPVVTDPAIVQAMPDAIMLATFAAGALFLLRHVRTRAASDLVLAGLGFGIAFGTKWYGVSTVLAVFAVWIAGLLLARRPWRRVAGDGALFAGLVALAGGFWLLRNLVGSANPLFPVKLEVAGVTIFDAPPDPVREAGGWTIAHYATDWDVWSEHLLPTFRDTLGPGVLLLGLAAVLGVAFALKARPTRGRPLAVAVGALLLAAVYAITPYTALGPEGAPVQADANVRYLVPALILAAPLLGWLAAPLGPRARLVVDAVLLVAVLDALARSFDVSRGRVIAVAAILAALGAIAWWARRVEPAERPRGSAPPEAGAEVPASAPLGAAASRRRRARAAAVGVAAVAVLAAVAAGGHVAQKRFNEGRYVVSDPTIRWLVEQDARDRRVGLASTWTNDGLSPVLPAFGERLDGEVEFVGPWVREMLRQYRDREPFLAAVQRGRYDAMVVGHGIPARAEPREERWLRDDGWRVVARSGRLTILTPR